MAVFASDSEFDVLVYGGFTGYELGDVWLFNTGNREWREILTTGNQPEKRSVFGYSVLGDPARGIDHCRFAIFGGEGSPSSLGHLGAGNFFADAFLLDLKTMVWREIGESSNSSATVEDGHPGPRGWLPMTTVGGNRLVVHGGLNHDNSRLGGLFVLELEQQ